MKDIVLKSFILNILFLLPIVISLDCKNQIHDDTYLLSYSDKEQICNKILEEKRIFFIVRLTKNIPSWVNSNNEYEIDKENENFSDTITYEEGIKSDFTLTISVYLNDRKIRVSAGKKIKNIVDISKTDKMIEVMKPYLRSKDYKETFLAALTIAINEYRKKSTDNYNYEYIRYEKQEAQRRREDYYTRKNRENENSSSSSSEFGLFLFIFIIFFIIIVVFIVVFTDKPQINTHFENLDTLIKEIQRKNPPITTISTCVLCFESFDKSDLICFSCGHAYHNLCINNMKNINKCNSCCMMCDEPTAVVYQKFVSQHVTEKNLINVINSFEHIHGESELKSFYKSKKNSSVKKIRSYDTNIYWLDDTRFIPNQNTVENNSTSNSSSYSTSRGTWSDDNNDSSSDNYETSGGSW